MITAILITLALYLCGALFTRAMFAILPGKSPPSEKEVIRLFLMFWPMFLFCLVASARRGDFGTFKEYRERRKGGSDAG